METSIPSACTVSTGRPRPRVDPPLRLMQHPGPDDWSTWARSTLTQPYSIDLPVARTRGDIVLGCTTGILALVVMLVIAFTIVHHDDQPGPVPTTQQAP